MSADGDMLEISRAAERLHFSSFSASRLVSPPQAMLAYGDESVSGVRQCSPSLEAFCRRCTGSGQKSWSWTFPRPPKRPVTLKQNHAILHPMMLVSIAIWESGDAKSQRIARCRIARPAVISIAWFCNKRFLYCFSKDCVPATLGSAKFVHRCLALRTPVLPAVMFRRIRQVERRFFFFALITVDSFCFFGETQTTKSRKVSWSLFSKRQSGPTSSRIPDRCKCGNLSFDKSRMVLRQECFGNHYLSEFRNKLAGGKRNTRNHRRQRARKKKPVDMLTFPATLDAESPRGWPKTTVWPWRKRCDEILQCRIVRFWYSVTGA